MAAISLGLQSFWLHPVSAQFTEDTLTIELSASGGVRVTEEITTDTTVSRITLSPITDKVSDLLAVDESNIILRSVLSDNEITIDTLGASRVMLTYNAEIVNRTLDIWDVQYTGAINSNVILPLASELLFVNIIPVDIVENTIVMPPGEVSLSYKTRSATTDSFVVSHNGTDYHVGILGVSEVSELSFEEPSKSIVIDVNTQGPMLVMIPTTLLGGPYDVRSSGGQEVQFREYYQNASHAWIRVEPPANTNSIRITGTTVIPEFHFSALLMVGITISLLLVLLHAFSRKWTGPAKSWRL